MSKAVRCICLVVFCVVSHIRAVPGKAELSFYLTPEDFSWSDYGPERSESIAPILDLSGEWQYKAGKKTGTIHVPSCYAGYNGIVTFTKQFVIPEDWCGESFLLKFYGIQHRATFHLNNAILGSREGSNIPFEISVPSRLVNFGESNTLVVEVDNRKLSKASLPLKSSVFAPRNYGGITREVFLMAIPPERIDSYNFIEIARDQEESEPQSVAVFELDLSILLDSDSGPVDVTAEVFNPDGNVIQQHKITVTGGKEDELIKKMIRLPISQPRRWYPSDPYLYRLSLSLSHGKELLDRIDRSFGLRPEQNGDIGLLDAYKLNSLRGVSRVEQWLHSGVSPSPRQLQEEIQLIQQLDINFVYCSYFPPHPYFINMCDSLGIPLFVEIPLFGVSTRLLAEPSVQSAAFSSVHDLQDLARLHPSIVAIGWGSGLEPSVHLPGSIINEWIHNLGTDLPCYVHTVGSKYEKAGINILKPYSLNGPNSENLIAEVSASVGYFIGEEAKIEQVHNVRTQLDLLDPEGASFFVNGFNDWFGDKPLLFSPLEHDLYRHSTGLTLASRQPRDVFYFLQQYNGEAAPDSIEYSEAHGREPPWQFLAVGLFFTALGLWIIRVDNLFRQNLRRTMLHSAGFFSDIRDRRFLQGSSTFFLVIFLAAGVGNIAATLLYTGRFKIGVSALAEHLIGYNALMVLLHSAAWIPARGILIAGLCALGSLLFLTFLIRLGSPRSLRKLTLVQSSHILFWSSIPALIILPLSAFYLRLENLPLLQWLIVTTIAIALIWFYTRLILAVAVGYRSGFLRPFMVLVGLPVFLLIAYIASLHVGRQSLYYVTYIINLFNLG